MQGFIVLYRPKQTVRKSTFTFPDEMWWVIPDLVKAGQLTNSSTWQSDCLKFNLSEKFTYDTISAARKKCECKELDNFRMDPQQRNFAVNHINMPIRDCNKIKGPLPTKLYYHVKLIHVASAVNQCSANR